MAESSMERLATQLAAVRLTAGYRESTIIYDVTETIAVRMEELGLTRTRLAERLGVSKAMVTKLLRGQNNFTVRTLVDLSRALECDLSIALIPATPAEQSETDVAEALACRET